jgi:hypothetical protein
MSEVKDFTEGQRVQAHPATDTWMRGDRYGTVERVGSKYVRVRMDISGHLKRFSPDNLMDATNKGEI